MRSTPRDPWFPVLACLVGCAAPAADGADGSDDATSGTAAGTTAVDGETTQAAETAPDPDTTDGTAANDTTGPSPGGALVIVPEAVVLAPGATAQFVAHTSDGDAQAVTWSVPEADGGSIDPSGLYHAPAAEGVFHVVATSDADSDVTAEATVTVAAVEGCDGLPAPGT